MPAPATFTSAGASPWQAATAGRSGKAAWPEIGVPGAPSPAVEPAPPPAPEPPAALLFDETELARVMAAVAATSRREGEAAAAARIAAAVEAISVGLATADAVLARRTQQFREAATTLAALATETVGRGGGKLAARLAEALATDCLSRFDPGLGLTVEVAPELADALAATLAAAPALRDRPGRIAVEAVAGLEPGAARLVWPDGLADWSNGRLHDRAAELIRRLTRPERGAAPAPTEPSSAATEGVPAR